MMSQEQAERLLGILDAVQADIEEAKDALRKVARNPGRMAPQVSNMLTSAASAQCRLRCIYRMGARAIGRSED